MPKGKEKRKKLQKLNLATDTESARKAFDVHDLLRSGKSIDLDPYRVASAIKSMKEKIDEMIGWLNEDS